MADEESLRESSSLGNFDLVQRLVRSGVDVNSRNSTNGWTALHWACKRNHFKVVEYLLQHKADASIACNKGKVPSDLTQDRAILSLLPAGPQSGTSHDPPQLPIIPNYLQNPLFPYTSSNNADDTLPVRRNMSNLTISQESSFSTGTLKSQTKEEYQPPNGYQCIVKARLANCEEKDFVEVELKDLSYDTLLKSSCEELEVSRDNVFKIRKLPNILVRKDKDVLRLTSNDYLELILKTS